MSLWEDNIFKLTRGDSVKRERRTFTRGYLNRNGKKRKEIGNRDENRIRNTKRKRKEDSDETRVTKRSIRPPILDVVRVCDIIRKFGVLAMWRSVGITLGQVREGRGCRKRRRDNEEKWNFLGFLTVNTLFWITFESRSFGMVSGYNDLGSMVR